MRKLKNVLRLYHEGKLSQRQIAKSLQLSIGVVNKYLKKAKAAGISWPLEEQDEQALENRLKAAKSKASPFKPIDFAYLHKELKRKQVTLQLLWEEHKENNRYAVSYSQFCLLYRSWKNCQPQSMRQTHKAGDKVFVDYVGPTVPVIDPDTGEVRAAQIFVGVLGASNYTYAEATWTQQLADWINSHQRMFKFFGGVPALVVPDNLKSAIQKSCRYEPDVNPAYADFIEHYGTAVLPARPRKPKDKAKAENAVLIVERWILARLRNRVFVGLAELNQAIQELLYELNHRPFQKLPGCRYQLFIDVDQPALKPLPAYPFTFAEYKKARVHIDYHIELDSHYYSLPYRFINKEIECRYTPTQVSCWYQNQQVALHVRSYRKGAHTTLAEHMPKSHQKHLQWSPSRFISWSKQIGVATTRLVTFLLESKPHPEQGYRSCLGLLSLAKRFGNERLEKACDYAWQLGAKTRRSVQSILLKQLENNPLPAAPTNSNLPHHENVRGNKHYA